MKSKYLQKDKKQDKKYLLAMVEVKIWNCELKKRYFFLIYDFKSCIAETNNWEYKQFISV